MRGLRRDRTAAVLALGWTAAGLVAIGASAAQPPAIVLALWLAPVLAVLVVRARGDAQAPRRAAEQAIAEERERIASELHDLVAHALSAMVVQAGAGRRADAEQAHAALAAVEDTGREALADIRLLAGLHRDDDALALAPQPGLAQVAGLARRARVAGLEVHLHVDGVARTLPAGIDLTAYRIVQLALGSAVECAEAARADVRVSYGADAVVVEVRDDGRRVVRPLAGVRERVALYGGELHAGLRSGGGHGVRARLPLGAAA
jgi:signal transduction histidine kinase